MNSRPYASDRFGALARLLDQTWPQVFEAEGDGWKLDRLVCPDLRVIVWMDGHPTTLPGQDGWQRVMVPQQFDEQITLRRVHKVLRKAARVRFDSQQIQGRG